MKLSLPSVMVLIAGAVLIYCGVKGVNPKDVILGALSGKLPKGTGKGIGEAAGEGIIAGAESLPTTGLKPGTPIVSV